jgi:hypothetical protein
MNYSTKLLVVAVIYNSPAVQIDDVEAALL